ncbi:MAG: hypothetical protein ABFD14_09805 [Anaerolineaceae bacterium]
MKRQIRSFDLVMVTFLLLLASIAGWLRLQQAIAYWDRLITYQMNVPPLYLAISGAVFGIVMLLAVIWLWFGLPNYRSVTAVAVISFSLWYWIDRLTLTRNMATQANWLFALFITLFLWIFTFAVLAAHPPLHQKTITRSTNPASAGEKRIDDAGN